MRAVLTMMMLAVVSTPWPARAQSSAAEPLEVPVHPGVTTVLHFPDDIEHVRFTAQVAGSVRATTSKHMLYVRPYRSAPAGMKISLEVTTATMYQRFRLRVVRRARDANSIFLVPVPEAKPSVEEPAPETGEATPDAGDTAPARISPDTANTASTRGPAASAPRVGREPARAEPVTAAVAAKQIESVPAAKAAGAPRFELAVHALVALPGFTSLDLAGSAPGVTWRAHRGLGVRLTAGPTGGWWNLEADVSGTWLAGALTYGEPGSRNRLEMSGPWLRAEVGVRARVGMRWRPSAYAGLGTQAHLRRTRAANSAGKLLTTKTMEDGFVLALGIGLHRRIRDVLLGLDVQVRRGGPDGYHSMTALWTVGYFLDLGE